MRTAALALIACLLGTAAASGPDTLWVRRLSFSSDAYGGGIASRGSAITTVGSLNRPPDSQNLVTARLDQDGDTLWTRVFEPGGQHAGGSSVCLDRESNTLLAGYSFSTGSERRQGNHRLPLIRPTGTGLSPYQTGDFAITAKYDSMGGLKWARIDSGYLGNGIAVDSSGNSYVTGQCFNDTGSDMWVAKLNSSGDTVWSRTYDLAWNEFANRVALDKSGDIITCDDIEDSTMHCLTVKLAPDGHIIWTERFDRDAEDVGLGVAVGPHGSIVIGGMMTPDFTAGHGLVLKYDSSGTLLWSRVLAFSLDDGLMGATCDSAGDIYIAGYTDANYEYQLLAMKLDSMGNTLWTATYGDSSASAGDIALDPVGDPIITGDIVDTTRGVSDFLIIKYSALAGIAESRPTGVSGLAMHTTITAAPDFVLSVPSAGHYDIRLCDLNGRTRQQLFCGALIKGAHRLSVSALPAGMYFVRVAAPDGGVSCQRLVLVK